MTVVVPRRGGSQILLTPLVFVTQFTIASSGAHDANCITPLPGRHKITHLAVRCWIANRVKRNFAGSSARAVEEILDLVSVGARELELMTALEREKVLAVHVRAQASHQA